MNVEIIEFGFVIFALPCQTNRIANIRKYELTGLVLTIRAPHSTS